MRFARRRRFTPWFLAFTVLALWPGFAAADADSRLAKARALFEQFMALSDEFDPAVTELYRDDARIIAYRVYPHGKERRMRLSGDQYKSMIRTVMPLARMRGDRSAYSDVTYAAEGPGVRISATRRSLLKGYSAPHSMLVAPDGTGAWRIHEEIIRTRP